MAQRHGDCFCESCQEERKYENQRFIRLDPNMITDMDIAGSVYYHSGFNVDVFAVRSKKKVILKIDDGIPKPLLLHTHASRLW